MNPPRALVLLPMVLAVAGCLTLGPNYKVPPEAVVNAPLANAPLDGVDGTTTVSEPVPPNWWHLYDDPVLNDLVQQAIASNTDLRVAAANLASSRAAVGVAEEQGGFSGGADAAFKRAQEAGQQFLIFSKIPVSNEGDLGVNVSYEFDLFGKLRRGVEAAKAEDDSVQAASDIARITVVADVARAYVENCSAAEELGIAEQSLDLQRQRVALSRRLQQAGRGNVPDVTRGQTQVDTLNADIPRFKARRRIAQYQLAMLLARAPSDLPKGVFTCHVTPKLAQPIPVGDGAALLRRRPDVRQAERRLASSTAQIGVATAALYPTVSFGASAGSTGLAADLFGEQTNRWAFGPLINWSFPINGARGRVMEAKYGADAALARFDGVVLKALRETQSSLATYAADYARADALRAAQKSAAESADETHRFYLAGRESFIADLDATRTLTTTNAQLAAAVSQVAVDQINLFLALGGGWESTAAPSGAAAAVPASGAQAN